MPPNPRRRVAEEFILCIQLYNGKLAPNLIPSQIENYP